MAPSGVPHHPLDKSQLLHLALGPSRFQPSSVFLSTSMSPLSSSQVLSLSSFLHLMIPSSLVRHGAGIAPALLPPSARLPN